jgi:hypothetical protein
MSDAGGSADAPSDAEGPDGADTSSRVERVREVVRWRWSVLAGLVVWAAGFVLTYVPMAWLDVAAGRRLDFAVLVYYEGVGGVLFGGVSQADLLGATLGYQTALDSDAFGVGPALHMLVPAVVLFFGGHGLADRHVRAGRTTRPLEAILAGTTLALSFTLVMFLAVLLADDTGTSPDLVVLLPMTLLYAGVFAAIGATLRSGTVLVTGRGLLAGFGAFLTGLLVREFVADPYNDIPGVNSFSDLSGVSAQADILAEFVGEHGLEVGGIAPAWFAVAGPLLFGAVLAYRGGNHGPVVGFGVGARLAAGYLVSVSLVLLARAGLTVRDVSNRFSGAWPSEALESINYLFGSMTRNILLAGVVYPAAFAAIGGAIGAVVYGLTHEVSEDQQRPNRPFQRVNQQPAQQPPGSSPGGQPPGSSDPQRAPWNNRQSAQQASERPDGPEREPPRRDASAGRTEQAHNRAPAAGAGSGPPDTGESANHPGERQVSVPPDYDVTGGQVESGSVPGVPRLSLGYEEIQKQELFGRGGNADVFRVTVETDGGTLPLALKEPRMSGTLHTEAVERMLAEAETWQKLDGHDNVVGVVDYGAQPLPWIAMEYMDAGHLGERSGEMGTAQALWTAIAVTRAVRHAHRLGVAHLDLKPANVLFRSVDGGWDVPKVTDWGLSKHLLNHSKSIEGLSPGYAAPEQFDAESYGGPDDVTDIYQLGAVLYELFTGRPPFEGAPVTVMKRAVEEQPVPPSERADVPPALDDVLLRALATEKQDRYESVLYLRDELQEVAESL